MMLGQVGDWGKYVLVGGAANGRLVWKIRMANTQVEYYPVVKSSAYWLWGLNILKYAHP